ncbi:glycosyltransferase family 4 protein [Yoonia sp.]|uniref:glycosyltransferase family 4 protein n=1 Tax=Yoonia sp. TaxID=2212373 RepID=UPI0025D22356|nr:glycosyltransferase family 4 protein [Yoonia sp.]
MHILYFHQHFSTPGGATGTRSYEMARRAIQYGHHVTMVCGSYGVGATGLDRPFVSGRRRGFVDGIDVIEFNLRYANTDSLVKRSGTFAKFAWGSIGLVMREKYDLVFATTTPLTAGIPGICARWLRRKPFVFEVRDLWPELPREMGVIKNPLVLAALSLLEWASYRSAHRCIALSPGIAKGIERRGVKPDQIALIPNGCDITLFNAPNVTPWRPADVSPADLMAIFTGTHGLANGLDALLDAAAVLKSRQRQDIKLVLVGAGKLKNHLIARADKESLTNVIFHDPIPKAQLAGLMAAADLGIQCLANVPAFYFGTSPNKFFDYIAAGLPVLNNYPGWLAEMIVQNDCGFAVPPDNAPLLASALQQAADDKSRLQQMGQNGAALAERAFDRRDLSQRWVEWTTQTVEN